MAAGGSSYVKMKSGMAKGSMLYVPPAANSGTGSTPSPLDDQQMQEPEQPVAPYVPASSSLAAAEVAGGAGTLPPSILTAIKPGQGGKTKQATTTSDGLPKPLAQQISVTTSSIGMVQLEALVQGSLAVHPHIKLANDGSVVHNNWYVVTIVDSGWAASTMHFNKTEAKKMMHFMNQTGIDWSQPPELLQNNQLALSAVKYGQDMIYEGGVVNCAVCGKLKNPSQPCFHCQNAAAIAIQNEELAKPPTPTGSVVMAGEVIKAMYNKDGYGIVYSLPSFEKLEAGKNITGGNAYQFSLNLKYILAKEGATSQGRITVSGEWLAALEQNKGRITVYPNGMVKGQFTDAALGEVTSYARIVPGADGQASQLRSYCSCGHNPCHHQMLMQAHALSGAGAGALMSSNFHQQQVAAHAPQSGQEYFHLSATSALKAQDAYYRSLQHLESNGTVVVMGDDSLVKIAVQSGAGKQFAPPATPLVTVNGEQVVAATMQPAISASLGPVGPPQEGTIGVKEAASSPAATKPATVQGGLAVVQTIKGWAIVHVPSQQYLTVFASTQSACIEHMKKLNSLAEAEGFDWRTITHGDFHKPDTAEKVKSLMWRACGQKPLYTNGVWQQPIISGLKAPALGALHPAPSFDQSHEFKVTDIYAANSQMQSAYKQQVGSISAAEQGAVVAYQSNIHYKNINDHLWLGNDTSNETVNRIQALDNLIARTSVPFPICSYRIQPKNHPLYNQIQLLEVGEEYQAKGYDSTSINPNWSWSGAGDGVRIEYRFPAGSRAFYFNTLDNSIYTSEYELLPARGSVWRLTQKQTLPNGKIEAVMELVSQPELGE